MDLHFRPAVPEDLDRLIEIHAGAYPDGRTASERRRNFTANPFGELDHLVVIDDESDLVAHAFLFELEAHFGGRPVPVGGVASVAVALEARGQGIASALMRRLHVLSDVRGDAITMLYPFRQGFYRRLGYAPVTPRRRLVLDPASVPRTFGADGPRILRARKDHRDAIRAAYARGAKRASGLISRPPALWERIFERPARHQLIAEGSGHKLAGYVAFHLAQEGAHAETRLIVEELVADDAKTRRALIGALGGLRDQVAEIELEVDAASSLEMVLVDADRRRHGDETVEHALGTVVGGPMVRIVDIPRALEARGYHGEGAFDVVVSGGSDDLAVHVRVEQDRAKVGPAKGGAAIRVTRAALSAILFGGLRLTDAVELGLADVDAASLAKIDALVQIPPLCPNDPF